METTKTNTLNNDSGISDGSPCSTDSDKDSSNEKIEENVTNQIAKIEALLAKINLENKKSEEELNILDKASEA